MTHNYLLKFSSKVVGAGTKFTNHKNKNLRSGTVLYACVHGRVHGVCECVHTFEHVQLYTTVCGNTVYSTDDQICARAQISSTISIIIKCA